MDRRPQQSTSETPSARRFLLSAPSHEVLRAIGSAIDATGAATVQEDLEGGSTRLRGHDQHGNPYERTSYADGLTVLLGIDDTSRPYMEVRWANGRTRRAVGAPDVGSDQDSA